MISSETKRYIRSALVTFFAGFALVMVTEIDSITLEDLGDCTAVGVAFAGVRTGLKMLLESFLSWYQKGD